MAKKYDLAVKVGSYVDRNGQEKNKWQNIGVVLDGQYGPYILLNQVTSILLGFRVTPPKT
jgi:hypothetical protein